MSTPCTIGILNKDYSIDCIYCHNDGYSDYMMNMLATHYNTAELAQSLINLGNLSRVQAKLTPTTKTHSFDHPESGVTIAYTRDRGEDWNNAKPTHYDDIDDFNQSDESKYYTYVFDTKSNQWMHKTVLGSFFVPFDFYKTHNDDIVAPKQPAPKSHNTLSDHINNMPDYANDYEYIVVRNCNADGIWFYGAYHAFDKAIQAAEECHNGIVIAKD